MRHRHELTDEQWERLEHVLPGRNGDPGRSGEDNRLFVRAVICERGPYPDGVPSRNSLSHLARLKNARRAFFFNGLLIDQRQPQFVIGDKAYDSDEFRDQIRRRGAQPVIPPRQGTRRRRYDRERYKLRNVAERFFGRLKHFHRAATRYEKTAVNSLGFVAFASLIIQLGMSTRPNLAPIRHEFAMRSGSGTPFSG